nr:DUF222 domain-containing protein [Propionicimonas sp.]
MFEYTDVSRLDAGAALGVLEQAQQARRRAEVQEALAMLRVVHTYRHQIPTDKVRLAGDGTGLIDDFACLELAAALHRAVESVTAEVIELLNLETRLPRLWETVVACGIPLWQARRIARITGELSLARARWVDATIAPFATRLAASRLLRFVEALVVQADPAAAEERWNRAARPRIEIGRDQRDGLRDIYGWLTAADAIFLDAALNQLSGILADQGSDQDAAERRATALGILATPARALAMIQQSISQPTLTDEPTPGQRPGNELDLPTVPEEQPRTEAASRRATDDSPSPRSPFGCPGHTCGTISIDPDRLLPKATLVIHLSDDTLTTGVGIGRCEQLGPLTLAQIRSVLGHRRVQVLPVCNPDGIVPVDSYEIPDSMRRAVLLRHRFEIFPYGTHPSTGLDLDHTIPYRHGPNRPPGQTRPDNLGPLRRKAHRAKTHAGWRLSQPRPGTFAWLSPLGRRYLVTPSGLTNDGIHAPGNSPWDNPVGGPLLPDPPVSTNRRGRGRRPSQPVSRRTGARPVLRR